MVRSYGYKPSGGTGGVSNSKDKAPKLSRAWEAADTAETQASVPAESAPAAPKGKNGRTYSKVTGIAVGHALSHVRAGEDLPKVLAERMKDEGFRAELIFRVGQKLGEAGLKGQELADAQERLAVLPLTASELLIEGQNPNDPHAQIG